MGHFRPLLGQELNKKEFVMKKKICMFVCLLILFVGLQGVEAGKKIKVGIIHLLAEHPDHIVLKDSFINGLKAKGYDLDVTVFDANSAKYPVTFNQRGADEAKRMEAAGMDLIYCTGMWQGVKNAKVKIPAIDSVHLLPVISGSAAVKADGKTYCSGNATGGIFGYSFSDVVNFVHDVLPQAKKLAYLHGPAFPTNRPVAELEKEAKKVGLEIIDCPFTTKESVSAALDKAIANADAGFASNCFAVLGVEKESAQQALNKKFPLIAGVVPLVHHGMFAAIQSDWTSCGEMCAVMADKILKGTPANSIPIEFPSRVSIGINLQAAEKLGMNVPFEWIEAAGSSGIIVE